MFFIDSTALIDIVALETGVTFAVSYADISATSLMPAQNNGTLTGSVAATMVAAPVSGNQRQTKYVSVYNGTGNSSGVAIRVNVSGTVYNLISFILDNFNTLVYDEHNGWQVILPDGSVKTGIVGPAGTNGTNGNTWTVLPGTPTTPGVNPGDLYLDGTNGEIYIWNGSMWFDSTTNITGPAGTPGSNGTNGTNGTNGANGNIWLTGSGSPSGVANAITTGDMYLNTANGDVYQASAPGTGSWGSPIENLSGPTGAAGTNGTNGTDGTNGNIWLTGMGVPGGVANALNAGDLYLNTTNGDVYQASAPGTGNWGSPIENLTGINGTDGTDGNLWFTGSGSPAGVVTATNAGDLYLDTSTGDVYQASAPGTGSWGSPIENLTGPAGPGSTPGGTVTGAIQYRSAGATFAGDDTAITDGIGNLTVTSVIAGAGGLNTSGTTNTNVLNVGGLTTLSGELEQLGTTNIYNNVPTAGVGVVPIYASGDVTAQTTAQTLATFTPATPGTFRISGYVTITAVMTDVLQLQVTYTDETSTVRTISFFPQGLTSASLATTGVFTFPSILIRSGASAINVNVVFTTGIGTVTYDAGGFIEQLS